MLKKVYKTPMSQLSSFSKVLKNSENFIERQLGQWMEGLYEQNYLKEESHRETYNKLDAKPTSRDPYTIGGDEYYWDC